MYSHHRAGSMNSSDFDADSLQHHGSDVNGSDGTPAAQTRKRKAGGASGRGVASLTAEQLAKKRANDREAQRAIRERTKNTIESLERRIQELTSQQPYQELQAIIRQKEAVQAENEEIRRRLASVVSILQPLLGAQGLSDLAQTAQHNVQVGLAQQNAVFQPEQFMTPTSLAPRSLPPQTATAEQTNYPSPFPSTDHHPSPDSQPWLNQRTALNNQRESTHRNHELSENGEKLNFSFLIDSTATNKNSFSPSSVERRVSPTDRSSFPPLLDSSTSTHVWSMLPKHCPPTCPLDNILMNFLQARQRENASYSAGSGQTSAYTSPAYPSISNLLNPANTTTSSVTSSPNLSRVMASQKGHQHRSSSHSTNSDPISTLMTDIISKFPHISDLPEQVATLYIMFLHMRWQIYPTQENYDRLPEWLMPRPSQLFTPHPAWVDHIPWPRMREKVVRNWHEYPFEHWFLPFTSGLSVNWPYEPVDCLISTAEQQDPIINPVFERHLRRLENWSIGPQFMAAYPALADTATVRDKPGSASIAFDHGQMAQGLANVGVGLSMHQGGQTSLGQQRQGPGNIGDAG